MKWNCYLLSLLLVLLAAPAPAQDTKLYPLVGVAQLSPDGQRLVPVAREADQVREQYEEIEILARLLDRGLTKIDGIRAVAFSPDGKVLASEGGVGVRLWDARTGRQLLAHHGLDLAGVQGVYLKGQGIVCTATIPAHFQKVVGGPDAPGPKTLTEWERVRKELRGEKIEADKPRAHGDSSIADAVLKVLADNGKNLNHLPDGESVTVAVTLVSMQACVKCHAVTGTGAGMMRGGMGGGSGMPGGGMMPPGSGGPMPGGSGPSAGGGAPGGSSGGQGPRGGGGNPSAGGGSGPVGGAGDPDGGTDRSEFRKQALVGDLAMRQRDYAQAADAYHKAIAVYARLPHDAATDLEGIEVATKLARAFISLGRTAEAERIVQGIVKMTDRLGSAGRPDKPAEAKPAMALPGKLIITVPKKLLDQAASGKMTFDEFRKSASVEHLTFDKPATDKAKAEAGKP